MNWFRSACLFALTISGSFAAWQIGIFFGHLDAHLDLISSDVHSVVLPTQKAEAAIASTAITFAQVGAQERNAFAEQQKYYVKLSSDTDRLIGSADDTLHAFNEVVIPKIGDTLDTGMLTLNRAGDSIDGLARQGQETLSKVEPVFVNLNADVTDLHPAIGDFNQIAANGQGISANLQATTGDIKDFVHRETTPIRGTWNMIKAFLREFAGPSAQVATAIK